ncbi:MULTISPECIES: acetyl-CoA carboxylase biotin carboxyl carrier protein [unclassified Nocardiopsis]|uniref:acetyl-CoA carboxylase biotin carboxyl carrier protein n=1 Tax=Nocardiopsis TaxID=2013 RepID=UPI00387B13D4
MTDVSVENRALDDLVRAVAELVPLADLPPRRISVRSGGIAVEVEWPVEGDAAEGVPATAAAGPPPAPAAPGEDPDHHPVCSELVGTFFTAPAPGADPFVAVGDVVRAGQQLAILESMKLMTPVTADRAGRVAEILAGDGDQVEFGTPLILLTAEAAA